MSFEFGDVVLVPFPFTDQMTSKKRPAVVVSSSDYQLHRSDLVLVATSAAQTVALLRRARHPRLGGSQPV
jgi:hypothetical protein